MTTTEQKKTGTLAMRVQLRDHTQLRDRAQWNPTHEPGIAYSLWPDHRYGIHWLLSFSHCLIVPVAMWINPLGTDVKSMSIPLWFKVISLKWLGNNIDSTSVCPVGRHNTLLILATQDCISVFLLIHIILHTENISLYVIPSGPNLAITYRSSYEVAIQNKTFPIIQM